MLNMRIVLNANGANTQHMGHHAPIQAEPNETTRNETKPNHAKPSQISTLIFLDGDDRESKHPYKTCTYTHAENLYTTHRKLKGLLSAIWEFKGFTCKYLYGFLSYRNNILAPLNCYDMIAFLDGTNSHTHIRTPRERKRERCISTHTLKHRKCVIPFLSCHSLSMRFDVNPFKCICIRKARYETEIPRRI